MAMQSDPPAGSAEGVREYTSLNLLVDEINKHASTQGYAVTKGHIRQVNEVRLRVDRGELGERRGRDEGRRGQTSGAPDSFMTTFQM